MTDDKRSAANASSSYYTEPCKCGANPALWIGHTQQCADANAPRPVGSLESIGIGSQANAHQGSKAWPVGDTYTHPDGTVFTRSVWGNWYGTDGSEVSDPYITFRRTHAGF